MGSNLYRQVFVMIIMFSLRNKKNTVWTPFFLELWFSFRLLQSQSLSTSVWMVPVSATSLVTWQSIQGTNCCCCFPWTTSVFWSPIITYGCSCSWRYSTTSWPWPTPGATTPAPATTTTSTSSCLCTKICSWNKQILFHIQIHFWIHVHFQFSP